MRTRVPCNAGPGDLAWWYWKQLEPSPRQAFQPPEQAQERLPVEVTGVVVYRSHQGLAGVVYDLVVAMIDLRTGVSIQHDNPHLEKMHPLEALAWAGESPQSGTTSRS